MDIKQHQNQLDRIFNKNNVELVYFFGSQARGEALPFSDLDFAVFLMPSLSKEQRIEMISNLRDEIEKIFEMPERVDVVCLNEELPIPLLRNIIYDSQLIFSNNEVRRINWEARAMSICWDWDYYQKQFDRAILKQPRV